MYSGGFCEDGGCVTVMMFDDVTALNAYKETLRAKYLEDLKGCIKMPAVIDHVAESAIGVTIRAS